LLKKNIKLSSNIMSCDGYNKTALMGNWYEERNAVPQPLREQPEHRQVREEDEAISYISRNNLLMPLGRVGRAHPWNTSSVIVDDGFKETKTMNKTTFDPTYLKNFNNTPDCRPIVKTVEGPREYPEGRASIQANRSKDYSLISQPNLKKRLLDVQREVPTNLSDFGSTLKQHGPDHGRTYNLTTYQQFHGRNSVPTSQDVAQIDGKKMATGAGFNIRPETAKGIKMTSPLTGEVFKQEPDPQQNTRIQRAWLPYVEGAVKAAEEGLQKTSTLDQSQGVKTGKLENYRAANTQVLNWDIATSLPMSDGVHTLRDKFEKPGANRRIRTDVTLIRNNPITKK